jgi:hypothetical protein
VLVGGGHLIDPAAPEVIAFIEEEACVERVAALPLLVLRRARSRRRSSVPQAGASASVAFVEVEHSRGAGLVSLSQKR